MLLWHLSLTQTWIKGLLHKNFSNPYAQNWALNRSSMKTWKSSPHHAYLTLDPFLHRVCLVVRLHFQVLIKLWSAPYWYELLKIAQIIYFLSSCTYFVSETTQNYHFWTKIVTKMTINGQYNDACIQLTSLLLALRMRQIFIPLVCLEYNFSYWKVIFYKVALCWKNHEITSLL